MTSNPATMGSGGPTFPRIEDVLALHCRTILQQCADFGLSYLVVRRGGAIVEADQRTVALLGYSMEELRALPDISMLIPPGERDLRIQYQQMRRRGETPSSPMRVTVLCSNGRQIPVDIVFTPIDDGQFTVLTFRDATDIADRDQLISWYTSLCDRMPTGAMIARRIMTQDGARLQLLSANPAASQAFSIDLQARIGDTLFEIFPIPESTEDRNRILAILGTDRIEYLPDAVIGPPSRPNRVLKRMIVALPNDAVALLVEDVTRMVNDDLHRRSLLERIVELGDAERRQIALGIHDEPLQQIAGAALLVAQMRRPDRAPREDWLAEVDVALHQSMELLRRLVFDLSPPELVQSGLATALSAAADHIFAGTGVWVHVERVDDAHVPEKVAVTAFRIAVEALNNARKHAHCSSVTLSIVTDGENLGMEITDDGGGFSTEAPLGHYGFMNIRDRAEAIGGTIRIATGPTGTRVSVSLPLTGSQRPGTPELTNSIRELDFERTTIALERDTLRDSLANATRAFDLAEKHLAMSSGLGPELRAVPAAERAATACRYLCRWLADGTALRLASSNGKELFQIASWHDDEHQLAFLNEHLFIDRSGETSSAHLVFRTGEPVLIDRQKGRWSPGDGNAPPYGPILVHSAILAPVRAGTSTIGVLTCCRDKTLDPFTPSDLRLVESLGDVLGAFLT